MQGRPSAIPIAMHDHTRATLVGWLRKQQTPVGLAQRARAMLRLADGSSFAATARQGEWRERHVRTWARRFVACGIDGLYAKKRPGRRPVFSPGGGVVGGATGGCTPRGRRAVAVAVGERRVGPAVGARRGRGGQLAADRPADAGAPHAATLAASPVAVAPGPPRCGLCGPGACHGHPLSTPLGGGGHGAVRGRANPSAPPDTESPDLGRPTGQASPGRTGIHPDGRPASLCRF
jgi:hypothetical protein